MVQTWCCTATPITDRWKDERPRASPYTTWQSRCCKHSNQHLRIESSTYRFSPGLFSIGAATMHSIFGKFWAATQHLLDAFIGRLPALIVSVAVFLLFYALSVLVSRVIVRTTRENRPNVGVVLAPL